MLQNYPVFLPVKRILLLCLIMLQLVSLYGCGGRISRPVYEPGPSYPEQRVPEIHKPSPTPAPAKLPGPAAPLYEKAKTLVGEKQYHQAELTMERALRIEPRNAYYWYTFAEIAFLKKDCGRAVQLSLKSKSLAGADGALIQRNNGLIAQCN